MSNDRFKSHASSVKSGARSQEGVKAPIVLTSVSQRPALSCMCRGVIVVTESAYGTHKRAGTPLAAGLCKARITLI